MAADLGSDSIAGCLKFVTSNRCVADCIYNKTKKPQIFRLEAFDLNCSGEQDRTAVRFIADMNSTL